MGKSLKILGIVLAAALYLNTGYGIGYYLHHCVKQPILNARVDYGIEKSAKIYSELNLFGKFLAEPCPNELVERDYCDTNMAGTKVLYMFFWPIFIFIKMVAIALKVVFAGGLFKLVFGV